MSPTSRPPFAGIDPEPFLLAASRMEPFQTPALAVNLDHVRENVRRTLAHLSGEPARWRPHLKTTKLPSVWMELAAAGVRQFKCATTLEARVFLETVGRDVPGCDLLVAYPLHGAALRRLSDLACAHPETRISALVETLDVATNAPESLGLFVDVNPGMDRTGIPCAHQEFILAVARAAGSRFRGVHFYDGHLHTRDATVRRRDAHAGYDQARMLCMALQGAGLRVDEIVTSGTPTFLDGAVYDGFSTVPGLVHRVSPGTLVFHDFISELDFPELSLLPAAVILSRVISHPREGVITCDAGSKALAAEAGDPCAFVLGHPEWTALGPNEEHLPLRTDGGMPPHGTLLALVPRHICPSVNLHDEALLFDAAHAPEWHAVAARGHETH